MKKIITCLCAFVSAVPAAIAADGVISRIVPSKTADTVVSPAPERGVAQRVNPERTTSEAVSSRPSSRGAATANGNARRDSATNRATSSAVRVRTTTTPTTVRTSDAQSGRAVNARGSASSRAATTNASRGTVARTSSNIQSRVASSAASRAAATRAVGAQNRTATGATARTTSTRNASTRAGNTVQSRASVLSRMFSATRKVDNAATKSLTDTISAMEDDKQITDFCKAQYSACMDNFCNVLDDAQGRCSCSKNIKNYAKSEEALKQANELLQDVAQQIQYIGLTRDEVETLFTQTAAEQAMQGVTDNSQIKTQLDKIYDMMVEVKPGTATATDTTDTGLSLDLNNLLDFTFDSTGFDLLSMFSTSEQSSSISNQRGEQLYKTAASRCKATVLDACRSQGVDVTLITNSYDLEIDKSCIAYERSLTDGNAEMRQTVRNAQNVLQRARLMVRQQKNTYDLRGCVTALDACMQDEFVCGADYENCLDPSGKYIVNGEVVIGSTPGQPVLDGYYLQPGYQYDTEHLYSTWNYVDTNAGDTNAWLSDGSLVDYIASTVGGIPDTTSEDMSAFLQYKIGYHHDDTDRNYGMCMSVLNKCQDITYSRDGEYEPDNNVIREYLQRTMTQIKVRQDAILAEYAESCIPDVKSCLSQNGYTTAPNIAINACRQQVVTCMSVTGDANGEPTPSIISQWVDDVQNGITERKQCERSGGTYNTSTGKCSCSASGLRVSTAGTSCECTNGGVWRNGSCYVAPTKCGLNQPVSGCVCYNQEITVNGVTWCVSISIKNDYMLCTTTGPVRGTWDTVNRICDCPSNSGWTNNGCACNSGYKLDGNGVCVETEPGGEDPVNTAETKCKNGGEVSGTWSNDTCTCKVANSERVTSNGYAVCNCKTAYSASGNSCVYDYADNQSACVNGGNATGTWNMSTHSCKCPSNSSNSNDQGCNCINGYEPDGNGGCRQSGQQPGEGGDDNDAATACESGDLVGQWNGTSCDCPSGASVDTDGSCKCGDGFVAQNNACVVSENPYGSGFTVQKTLWDNDTEIAIASDDATDICYATVADSDGNFNVSAGTACIVNCEITTATADICENAVIMNNASSTQGWALYAMRNAVNGGIEFSFGDTNVNSLKMALVSGELPEKIDWVKGITDGTDYKLWYAAFNGDVYYDADGIRQRTDSVSELDVVFVHKDSNNLETCEEGEVRGKWNFYTHACDCSGDYMTSNGDYACACNSGYEPDGNGGCVEKESGGDDVEPDEAEKERLCTESNGRWGGGCDCTVSQGGIYNPDTYSCICNVDQGFEAGVPSERGGCTCLTGTAERIDGIWTCKNESGGEGGGNEGGDDTGSAEETACTESGGTWTNGTCACETGYEPNDNGECVEKESGGEGGDNTGGGNEGGDDTGDENLSPCNNGAPISINDKAQCKCDTSDENWVVINARTATNAPDMQFCYSKSTTDSWIEAYNACAAADGTYWLLGGGCKCVNNNLVPLMPEPGVLVCDTDTMCKIGNEIINECTCKANSINGYCCATDVTEEMYENCVNDGTRKWSGCECGCADGYESDENGGCKKIEQGGDDTDGLRCETITPPENMTLIDTLVTGLWYQFFLKDDTLIDNSYWKKDEDLNEKYGFCYAGKEETSCQISSSVDAVYVNRCETLCNYDATSAGECEKSGGRWMSLGYIDSETGESVVGCRCDRNAFSGFAYVVKVHPESDTKAQLKYNDVVVDHINASDDWDMRWLGAFANSGYELEGLYNKYDVRLDTGAIGILDVDIGKHSGRTTSTTKYVPKGEVYARFKKANSATGTYCSAFEVVGNNGCTCEKSVVVDGVELCYGHALYAQYRNCLGASGATWNGTCVCPEGSAWNGTTCVSDVSKVACRLGAYVDLNAGVCECSTRVVVASSGGAICESESYYKKYKSCTDLNFPLYGGPRQEDYADRRVQGTWNNKDNTCICPSDGLSDDKFIVHYYEKTSSSPDFCYWTTMGDYCSSEVYPGYTKIEKENWASFLQNLNNDDTGTKNDVSMVCEYGAYEPHSYQWMLADPNLTRDDAIEQCSAWNGYLYGQFAYQNYLCQCPYMSYVTDGGCVCDTSYGVGMVKREDGKGYTCQCPTEEDGTVTSLFKLGFVEGDGDGDSLTDVYSKRTFEYNKLYEDLEPRAKYYSAGEYVSMSAIVKSLQYFTQYDGDSDFGNLKCHTTRSGGSLACEAICVDPVATQSMLGNMCVALGGKWEDNKCTANKNSDKVSIGYRYCDGSFKADTSSYTIPNCPCAMPAFKLENISSDTTHKQTVVDQDKLGQCACRLGYEWRMGIDGVYGCQEVCQAAKNQKLFTDTDNGRTTCVPLRQVCDASTGLCACDTDAGFESSWGSDDVKNGQIDSDWAASCNANEGYGPGCETSCANYYKNEDAERILDRCDKPSGYIELDTSEEDSLIQRILFDLPNSVVAEVLGDVYQEVTLNNIDFPTYMSNSDNRKKITDKVRGTLYTTTTHVSGKDVVDTVIYGIGLDCKVPYYKYVIANGKSDQIEHWNTDKDKNRMEVKLYAGDDWTKLQNMCTSMGGEISAFGGTTYATVSCDFKDTRRTGIKKSMTNKYAFTCDAKRGFVPEMIDGQLYCKCPSGKITNIYCDVTGSNTSAIGEWSDATKEFVFDEDNTSCEGGQYSASERRINYDYCVRPCSGNGVLADGNHQCECNTYYEPTFDKDGNFKDDWAYQTGVLETRDYRQICYNNFDAWFKSDLNQMKGGEYLPTDLEPDESNM